MNATTAPHGRRILWLNVLTVFSAAILIGAEVFGGAFAAGWAFANWLHLDGYAAVLSQAQASGLPRLSSDVTRKRLAGLAPHERGGPELYSFEASYVTYAQLGRLAFFGAGLAQLLLDGAELLAEHIFLLLFADFTLGLSVDFLPQLQNLQLVR